MMILMQLIATVMLLLQVVPNLEDGGVFGICNRLNVPPPPTRQRGETEDESDSETQKYPLVTKVPMASLIDLCKLYSLGNRLVSIVDPLHRAGTVDTHIIIGSKWWIPRPWNIVVFSSDFNRKSLIEKI